MPEWRKAIAAILAEDMPSKVEPKPNFLERIGCMPCEGYASRNRYRIACRSLHLLTLNVICWIGH